MKQAERNEFYFFSNKRTVPIQPTNQNIINQPDNPFALSTVDKLYNFRKLLVFVTSVRL